MTEPFENLVSRCQVLATKNRNTATNDPEKSMIELRKMFFDHIRLRYPEVKIPSLLDPQQKQDDDTPTETKFLLKKTV